MISRRSEDDDDDSDFTKSAVKGKGRAATTKRIRSVNAVWDI